MTSILSVERNRNRLKKVFSPELGVAPSPQLFEIPEYACGLRLGRALISSENPIFEMASGNRLNFEIASRRDLSWQPPAATAKS
jgi:hypothetical protein